MNRGLARRTLFETRADMRFFLSRLARAVRRGDIEVHAFSILATHFHLLVRSPRSGLSAAMRVVQNEYVRRFNRSRRRDGPLVRGRFRSKPVETVTYRSTLVRYIDQNPVCAGLVSHPCAYPHGSARHYARAVGPPWLTRSWVEGLVLRLLEAPVFTPGCYARYAGMPLPSERARWIEARIEAGMPPVGSVDPLDDLVRSSPTEVARWMRRKAHLADGTDVGLPLVAASACLQVVRGAQAHVGAWTIRPGRKTRSAWELALAGLLRDLAACPFPAMAKHLRVSPVHASRLYRAHSAMLEDAVYAERVAQLAARVLAVHRE